MIDRAEVPAFLKIPAAALLFALPLLMSGCEGSATQTTNNIGIHGKLVDAEGNPLNGVEVQAYPLGFIGAPGGPMRPSGRTLTDAGGNYRLSDLAGDVYNIFARQPNGNRGVLIPEVRYAAGDTDLGTDTLVAPGAIAGKVTVEGGPMPEVFCYIPGSSVAAITDSTGHFILSGLPPGTYSLRFVAHDLETATRAGIRVSSDSVTVLEPMAMLYDSRLAPGIPRQLEAEMIDIERNQFRLSWIPPASADVEEYRLYAEYFPSGDTVGPRKNDTLILTGFDAAAIPQVWEQADGYPHYEDSLFRGKDTILVRYRLQAIDTFGNAGLGLSNPAVVRLVRPAWMKYDLTLTEASHAPGGPGCADTLRFHAQIVPRGADTLLIDSIRYYWTLTFFKDGARMGEFGGKYYDGNGTLHPAEHGSDFSWWDAHPGAPWIDRPDSLSVEARVLLMEQGQFDGGRLWQHFNRDSTGCFRAAGPPYEPLLP